MKLGLPPAFKPLTQFLAKHHAVLFISFIMLLLALAVYFLYVTSMVKQTETTTSTIGQFDQATIDKIKRLHDSSDASNKLVFPSPRSNPFVEPTR
jgi:predicted PurR-regulated permease PerM